MSWKMMIPVALTIYAAPAASHSLEWHAGVSKLVSIGQCAKGPCMRRATFLPAVPHRHLSKSVCIGAGAAGYRLGEVFPC